MQNCEKIRPQILRSKLNRQLYIYKYFEGIYRQSSKNLDSFQFGHCTDVSAELNEMRKYINNSPVEHDFFK